MLYKDFSKKRLAERMFVNHTNVIKSKKRGNEGEINYIEDNFGADDAEPDFIDDAIYEDMKNACFEYTGEVLSLENVRSFFNKSVLSDFLVFKEKYPNLARFILYNVGCCGMSFTTKLGAKINKAFDDDEDKIRVSNLRQDKKSQKVAERKIAPKHSVAKIAESRAISAFMFFLRQEKGIKRKEILRIVNNNIQCLEETFPLHMEDFQNMDWVCQRFYNCKMLLGKDNRKNSLKEVDVEGYRQQNLKIYAKIELKMKGVYDEGKVKTFDLKKEVLRIVDAEQNCSVKSICEKLNDKEYLYEKSYIYTILRENGIECGDNSKVVESRAIYAFMFFLRQEKNIKRKEILKIVNRNIQCLKEAFPLHKEDFRNMNWVYKRFDSCKEILGKDSKNKDKKFIDIEKYRQQNLKIYAEIDDRVLAEIA